MERRIVTFVGRVQGVGFRATAVDVASGFPVSGWVRNEPDDSVRLEVQGASSAVEGMLADLRVRMKRNIVRELVSAGMIEEGEEGFRIRR
jgi:acylphosphatase